MGKLSELFFSLPEVDVARWYHWAEERTKPSTAPPRHWPTPGQAAVSSQTRRGWVTAAQIWQSSQSWGFKIIGFHQVKNANKSIGMNGMRHSISLFVSTEREGHFFLSKTFLPLVISDDWPKGDECQTNRFTPGSLLFCSDELSQALLLAGEIVRGGLGGDAGAETVAEPDSYQLITIMKRTFIH